MLLKSFTSKRSEFVVIHKRCPGKQSKDRANIAYFLGLRLFENFLAPIEGEERYEEDSNRGEVRKEQFWTKCITSD